MIHFFRFTEHNVEPSRVFFLHLWKWYTNKYMCLFVWISNSEFTIARYRNGFYQKMSSENWEKKLKKTINQLVEFSSHIP